MEAIGFIGLGHMGKPMVKNLCQNGYPVFVFDIDQNAVESTIQYGAKAATSLKQLAENSKIIFTMLQTGEQVKSVCFGKEGVFNFLAKDGLYIDTSSINIMHSRELHKMAKRFGLAMIDAPVSGGVAGAIAATLTFMVGGEKNHFFRAKKILKNLGKKIIYAGAPGNGQAAKICNNMILGISMIAVSEGFILAKQLGLDPKKFYEIANNASGQCWALSKYCPMPDILQDVPSSKQFTPGFAATMMLKDLQLSQDAASEANVHTPLGREATALYALLVKEGNGNLDFSAIIKLIEQFSCSK